MKSWFQYEYGYLNVDKENMYFTNTGNGSELRMLKELPFGKKRVKRKNPFLFYWSLVFPFCYFLYDEGLTAQSVTVMVAFLLVFSFVYKYLRTEMGISMWIPFNRIQQISITVDFAEITYLDPVDYIQSVELDKVEKDGILYLTELRERLNLETL